MNLVEALLSQPREFLGSGTNHEGESFVGRLRLEPLVSGRAIMLRYTATGPDGRHFHEEASLLAMGVEGSLCLWPVMEELPFVLPHSQISTAQAEGGTYAAVFASGPRGSAAQFREEITIELQSNSQLVYAHAWGMPGGPFDERSRCVLFPAET